MTCRVVQGAAFVAVSIIGLSSVAVAAEVKVQEHLPKMTVQTQERVMKPSQLNMNSMKPVTNLAKPHLACKAWGSPEEFPAGILLTNDGALSIAAGTHIHWVMNGNHNQHGDYTFAKMLAHGKSRPIPGVPGGTGRGAPCTVTFAK